MHTVFSFKDNKRITTVYNNETVIRCICDGIIIFEMDEDNDLDILTNSRIKSKQKIENKIRKKIDFKQDGIAAFIIGELLTQTLSNLITAQNKSNLREHCEVVRCILGVLDQAQSLGLLKPSTAKEEKDLGSVLKIIKDAKRKSNN